MALSAIKDPTSDTDMAALQIDMTLKSSTAAAANVLCDGCYVWMYTSLASTSDPNSYETSTCLVQYNYATSQEALSPDEMNDLVTINTYIGTDTFDHA